VPEPRASRGRDFTPAPPVQYDTTGGHENDYQAARRRNNRLPGDKLRAPRRTRYGWSVEIRNGLPEPGYRWHAKCPGCDRCKETCDA
jgi:hypothetical protein